MTALIKMSNWQQIEVSLESPEDVAKLATFINEGCVVVIGYDKESIEQEEQLVIKGKIIE
jgi:hypothetical protein